MDVKNGSEGGGKLICEVGCIGSWLCVERGSENVTFEVININGIVGAVLDGCSFGCRTVLLSVLVLVLPAIFMKHCRYLANADVLMNRYRSLQIFY